MSKPFAIDGKKEFISSNTIMIEGNSELILAPISDKKELRFFFQIDIGEEDDPKIDVVRQETMFLRIVRGWDPANPLINTDFAIGADPDYKYSINFIIALIGPVEDFISKITYCIIRSAQEI